MVYLAGDNSLDQAGVDDLAEMKKFGSTEQINIVAQFDRQGPKVETCRYLIARGSLRKKGELGETDTGSPAVLIDFAKWAINNYPAQHYMLIIWNHGNGWEDDNFYLKARQDLGPNIVKFRRALFRSTIKRATRGIAYDDTSKDFLDNLELKKVLKAVQKSLGRKLDVLGMDACLMSMVEIGYQLREHVGLTVASEHSEPDYGWPYDDILEKLNKKPEMSPRAFSSRIVRCYLDAWDSKSNVTLAACDLSKSEDLGHAIDELAAELIPEIVNPAMRCAVLTARVQAQSYYRPEYIDLYDFCGLIANHCSSERIHAACINVQQVIKKGHFVVANGSRGSAVKNSHGVSIYFPEPASSVSGRISPLYARNLEFAQKFRWAGFLTAWLKSLERPA